MMSRLILTLTKQVFDNQFTHFNIKLENFCVECKSLKGFYFIAKGLVEENATIFANFFIRCLFFLTSYFSSEKDSGAVKIVSHILTSQFKKQTNQKHVKIVSLVKRQSHT